MKSGPPPNPAPVNRKLVPEAHFLDVESELSITDLVEHIRRFFTSSQYRPPSLPSVALDLVALSRRPDVEVKEVVALLEQDSLLTASVLQRANSALYASRMPTLSLKQAVTRLGLATLRDLVLEAALNLRVFRAEGYADFMEALRLHSGATAHLARLLCRYTPLEGDYAFLCGLLHDVGIAATLVALSEGKPRDRPRLQTVLPAVVRTHEEISAHVLTLWKLPAELSMVVSHHHTAKIGGHTHPLVAVVALAEHLAAEGGLAVAEMAPALAVGDACRTLNISGQQWLLAKEEAVKVLDEVRKPPARP